MEAVLSCQAQVNSYESTRRHVLQDSHRSEKFWNHRIRHSVEFLGLGTLWHDPQIREQERLADLLMSRTVSQPTIPELK
jgi:hypothetical protein